MSEFEAWLVDLDGTLYNAKPVKVAMAVELAFFGWSAVKTLRRFRAEHEVLRGIDGFRGDAYASQLQRTAEALGTNVEQVRSCVDEWMIRRPGKWLYRFRNRELLDELGEYRKAGGRLALVSDYPAQSKLESLGCRELFEYVVANGEAGGPDALKPDPAGYLKAAGLLGVAPTKCLVVGDRDDADGEAAARGNMAFRRIG